MHPLFLALVIAVLASSPSVRAARAGDPETGSPPARSVIARHPLVQASLDRLWDGSQSWRAGLERVWGTGFVVVATPDEVVVQDGDRQTSFEADLLAEVTPIADANGRVSRVLVVVNVGLIEARHGTRFATRSELYADLDRVLAHEVYGHALPYLIAGHVSGRCADPAPGERPQDSCAIRRENIIREELGLGRRTDAGLHGLALARRSRY